MLFAVIQDKLDFWLWLGYGLIILEGITLMLLNYLALWLLSPETILPRKKINFDIYLPIGLANTTKLIYTCIMGVILIITIYRLAS